MGTEDATAAGIAERLLARLKKRGGDLREDLEEPAKAVAKDWGELLSRQIRGEDVSREVAHAEAQLAALGAETAIAMRGALREVLIEIAREVKSFVALLL